MPTRTRPPTDGRCQLCKTHVGTFQLVWDHCHKCGAERGWTCNPCNLAMTEHIISNWDSAQHWLFTRHECAPTLFPTDARTTKAHACLNGETRTLFLGQGKGDPRSVRVSNVKGFVTVEQLAVFMGVTPGTVRDTIYGRRGRHHAVVKVNRAILIPIDDAINFITKQEETE